MDLFWSSEVLSERPRASLSRSRHSSSTCEVVSCIEAKCFIWRSCRWPEDIGTADCFRQWGEGDSLDRDVVCGLTAICPVFLFVFCFLCVMLSLTASNTESHVRKSNNLVRLRGHSSSADPHQYQLQAATR